MINLSGGATTGNATQKPTPTATPTSSYRPPSEISNNSQKSQQTFKLDLSEPQEKLEIFK